MDKIKIGEKIKEAVAALPPPEGGKVTLNYLSEWLLERGIILDKAQLSRMMNGNEAVLTRHYESVCRALGIDYEEEMKAPPLNIGFSQGFWAAPLLVNQNQETTENREFLRDVRMTAYSFGGVPHFNDPGEPLKPFANNWDENKAAAEFYFSGEIIAYLRSQKGEPPRIDIGFCGSTIFKDSDTSLLRVARLVDARASRHAGVCIAPKGVFSEKKDEKGNISLTKQQVALRYLLGKEPSIRRPCHILYQRGSTSERECQLLFQETMHSRETIQILNLGAYKEELKRRLREKPYDVWAQVALMLTTTTAASAARELEDELGPLDVFEFRTADFAAIMDDSERARLDDGGFYYEMCILRERADEILRHPSFYALLDFLKRSVDDLNHSKTLSGVPDDFRRVADFWGLPTDKVNERLKRTDFSLTFYPDFVKRLMDMMRKRGT